MTTNSGAVTVIGLGDMGSALAGSLLNHGFSLTLWNRNADKAAPLVDRGATLADEVSVALSASPATIVCLSNHSATMEVLSSARPDAAAGRTVIQLSTVTSTESLALADWAGRVGADYLDGQILSFVDDIYAGRANIVCSGPRTVFERHAGMLTAMAGNVHLVGEGVGAAPSFDKAHLSFAIGNYLAFLQGAAMCARSGVDLRAWCDFNLRHLDSGAVSRELAILADQICNRTYDEGLDATMAVWQGAVDKTREECAALGVEEAHLAPLGGLMHDSVDAGWGDKELGALFELMTGRKRQRPAG